MSHTKATLSAFFTQCYVKQNFVIKSHARAASGQWLTAVSVA